MEGDYKSKEREIHLHEGLLEMFSMVDRRGNSQSSSVHNHTLYKKKLTFSFQIKCGIDIYIYSRKAGCVNLDWS